MKRDFQILTDALCDLPASWVAARDYLTVVDTPINISGKHNVTLHDLTADDFGQIEQFVKQGDRAMTSQPPIFDPDEENPRSIEYLTRHYVREGKDVIYIVMNSALSGAYNMASVLFCDMQSWAEGQGRRVICIDSKCMSTGLALLFLELDKAIRAGTIENVDDIHDFVMKERGHIGHFFTWGELSYIKLSGRVDAVRAMIGTILGIRLVCSAQYINGETRKLEHINPHAMIRGIAKFGEALGIYARKHITNPNGPIIIAHGNVPRDAQLIADRMRKYLPNAEYLIGDQWRCGAGIQVHGGPTSIHVNFRTDNIGVLGETRAEMEALIREMRRK